MSPIRLIAAALAAATAMSPVMMAPAFARSHGSVSVEITPKGQDAEVVREGFFLYSLFKGSKNRATINQHGTGNGAAIAQHGTGNTAEIVQRGSGHTATATQTGRNNWLGIFQFGRNTSSSVSQTGNGQTGLVINGGW